MQRKWKCGRWDYNFTRKSIVNIHSLMNMQRATSLYVFIENASRFFFDCTIKYLKQVKGPGL